MTDPTKKGPPAWSPRGAAPRPGALSPRDAVLAAKQRQGDRPLEPEVGGRFDQPVSEEAARAHRRGGAPDPESARLSAESARGLEALAAQARATAAAAASAPPPAVESSETEKDDLLRAMHAALDAAGMMENRDAVVRDAFRTLGSKAPLSQDEIDKAKLEAKLKPMDVGSYLISNYLEQEVPVIDTGAVTLMVRFRSAQDGDEEFVEMELRKFRATTPPPAPYEFLRHQSRVALAMQIRSYNGSVWPKVHKNDGSIDETAYSECLDRVRQLPSHIFQRLAQHAGWFNDRIEALLTDREVLGKS